MRHRSNAAEAVADLGEPSMGLRQVRQVGPGMPDVALPAIGHRCTGLPGLTIDRARTTSRRTQPRNRRRERERRRPVGGCRRRASLPSRRGSAPFRVVGVSGSSRRRRLRRRGRSCRRCPELSVASSAAARNLDLFDRKIGSDLSCSVAGRTAAASSTEARCCSFPWRRRGSRGRTSWRRAKRLSWMVSNIVRAQTEESMFAERPVARSDLTGG